MPGERSRLIRAANAPGNKAAPLSRASGLRSRGAQKYLLYYEQAI